MRAFVYINFFEKNGIFTLDDPEADPHHHHQVDMPQQDETGKRLKLDDPQSIDLSFQSLLKILMTPLLMILYLFTMGEVDNNNANITSPTTAGLTEEEQAAAAVKPMEPIMEEGAVESSGKQFFTTSVYLADEVTNLAVTERAVDSGEIPTAQPAEDDSSGGDEIVVQLAPQL